MEAVNLSSRFNKISDELYLQRVYISHLLLFFLDIYKQPHLKDYKLDFMVEFDNKENYGIFSQETFPIVASDLSETKFKEIIEARARAKHRFKKEIVYENNVESMLKSNEGRIQFIQAFYKLIQKDHSKD